VDFIRENHSLLILWRHKFTEGLLQNVGWFLGSGQPRVSALNPLPETERTVERRCELKPLFIFNYFILFHIMFTYFRLQLDYAGLTFITNSVFSFFSVNKGMLVVFFPSWGEGLCLMVRNCYMGAWEIRTGILLSEGFF
jgi:hypothetical protein